MVGRRGAAGVPALLTTVHAGYQASACLLSSRLRAGQGWMHSHGVPVHRWPVSLLNSRRGTSMHKHPLGFILSTCCGSGEYG